MPQPENFPTAEDFEKLRAIESRGLCWSIGSGRIHKVEVRIYPRNPDKHRPTITTTSYSFSAGIRGALSTLGDRGPSK